ncbi:L,D-transpeptidase family protein [Legionella sp. CNM-4043-24]|uniref:L,D-transpeptidase family protein n=1 Tax=Legionella sp. CNM-4043-24 TaxID=3421646 RepID=UPI00403B1337
MNKYLFKGMMAIPRFKRLLLAVAVCISSSSFASTWVLPDKGDLVGEVQYATSLPGETLAEAGVRFDIGYYEMRNANPRVDPLRTLAPGTRLLIPSLYILPPGKRQGLVINLAEYRLYYYPPGDNVVVTAPVGIGREGWNTPIGETRVTAKERDPIWRPTDNVRAEAARHGTPIPNSFPPGAGNPLGRHVLRLGWPTYLIHGTNRRDGVGSRVSAGCIRMTPEDIESLFDQVPVGTPVRVINQSVKTGYDKGKLYMEVHPLLEQSRNLSLNTLITKQLSEYGVTRSDLIASQSTYPDGVPAKVS